MITAPAPVSVALLLGLSFFLGLAFEDFFARTDTQRPGGIRTFPMLALAGGVLYLFDPLHFIPFTGGLLVLGAWLVIYYREHVREREGRGEPNVGLLVMVLNIHAYLLGAIALALPHWIAVATTVTSVLLLTGRERLHELARRIELREIVTAGQFLILTGIILPLLPSEPVTTLTSITPRQAWLALVAVSSISYASYLAQRYWPPAAGGLWMAALGGLYSSTATTVALARQTKTGAAIGELQAGITLASGIMYLRILAIVAVFNLPLAYRLALPTVRPFLGGSADLRAAILAHEALVGQDASDAAADRRQSARPRFGGAVLGSFYSGFAALDLGQIAVRSFRPLFARRGDRHHRCRSVRPQPGAGRNAGGRERNARSRNPYCLLVQQYFQGRLRGCFHRRARDRRKRCARLPALAGVAVAILTGGP